MGLRDLGDSRVPLHQVADVGGVVGSLVGLDVLVVGDLGERSVGVAAQGDEFAFGFVAEGGDDLVGEEGGADHAGAEGVGDGEEAFLEEVLALVEVGEQFRAVLDVGADEGSVGVRFEYFLEGVEGVLVSVREGVVIVIGRRSEKQVVLLGEMVVTLAASWAVSSMSLVLEVTDSK